MKRTALVIGATGGVGGETAAALAKRGWTVRALHRDPSRAEASGLDVEWVKGDAMNAASVLDAASTGGKVDVIFHGANPPGYRNWRGLALPMLESTIAAAEKVGARIAFPGTVYNFAPDTFPRIAEDAPQVPRTRKGKIRVEMEQRLQAVAERGRARVLIVRAGDFFGSRARNSWFSQGLVRPDKPLSSLMYPAAADLGHAWAYLPDLAETFVELLERESELDSFARFHFRGHYFARGIEIAEATREAAGVPRAPIRSFPWFALYLIAPFHETFREMIEMRYLWNHTHELVNDKLVAFLGREPHTPTRDALRATLAGLGAA